MIKLERFHTTVGTLSVSHTARHPRGFFITISCCLNLPRSSEALPSINNTLVDPSVSGSIKSIPTAPHRCLKDRRVVVVPLTFTTQEKYLVASRHACCAHDLSIYDLHHWSFL